MQELGRLFARYARASAGRWWIGERPDGREGQLPRLIAAKIGYPTAREDPFDGGIVPVPLAEAAHVLAVAGTLSLAYHCPSPKAQAVDEARDALRSLADRPVFLSNGSWRPELQSWTPLSSATFDCGVIGYDAQNAFIFWIEEED